MTSILSSPYCASDVIQCLKLQEVRSGKVRFDQMEATQFVFVLSQASSIPTKVACVLKQLPLFRLVDNSYVALSIAQDFCILPEDVPRNGLSTFHEATSRLVLTGPTLTEEQFYKKVIGEGEYEDAKLSVTQFYSSFVIPNIACLSEADLLEHLQYVYHHARMNRETWKGVVDELKVAELVTCKNGSRHEASKFYDPGIEFFMIFYHQKLPPPEWWQ